MLGKQSSAQRISRRRKIYMKADEEHGMFQDPTPRQWDLSVQAGKGKMGDKSRMFYKD